LLASLEKLGSVSLVVNHEWHIDHGELHMASGARYELPRVDGLLPQNVAAAVQALEAGQFCTLSQGLLDQLSDLAVPGRRSLHRLGSVEVLLDVAHNVEAVA
jgi:folylpolyglutamate synthase/dihydropteroate synthase